MAKPNKPKVEILDMRTAEEKLNDENRMLLQGKDLQEFLRSFLSEGHEETFIHGFTIRKDAEGNLVVQR